MGAVPCGCNSTSTVFIDFADYLNLKIINVPTFKTDFFLIEFVRVFMKLLTI